MDDEDLYDEFGNLIGEEFDSDDESSSEAEQSHEETVEEAEGEDEDEHEDDDNDEMNIDDTAANSTDLVKHTLSSTFGPGVETIISRPTDEMADEPVIQPLKTKQIKVEYDVPATGRDSSSYEIALDDSGLPECIYSRKYMVELASQVPDRIRNIALVGGLHSGKSTIVDMLVLHTHSKSIQLPTNLKTFKPLRYMDNHKLEIDRGITIKANAMTLLLANANSKSYVVNLLDTPGHPNFIDETFSAMQTVDGIVYVVDVVEGLKNATDKQVLTRAIKENLPITVCLNKIDRLILELRLPVHDSYYKIRQVLEEVNEFIANTEFIGSYKHESVMSPLSGNVLFASSSYQFCFDLEIFANLYSDSFDNQHDLYEFSKNLWGEVYYNEDDGEFTDSSNGGQFKRSFNTFVLEPIYKLFTATITSDISGKSLSKLLWDSYKIKLHKSKYKQDVQILLKDVLAAVFDKSVPMSGFTNMVAESIPSPVEIKTTEDTTKHLVAHVTKLVEHSSGDKYYALARVYQGTIKVGDSVKVLGENFLEDEEDQRDETVTNLYLPGGRYLVPIESMGPGGIVLIQGVDTIITKGATIVESNWNKEISEIYIPPAYSSSSVFKVSLEPAKPSHLPLLLEGLRKLNKSYLSCVVKVEESGEHVILSPGEIYMDCMLHDLRFFLTNDLEIKVSDPMTKFSETCIDSSVTKIPISSANGFNKISIIAEPVDDPKLSRAIENGEPLTPKRLRKEFEWDSLASRSVWGFSSSADGRLPSILLDDTLEGETNKDLLTSVKDSVALGFKWSTDEGPLCDEPIRDTKFKILDAVLSEITIQRNGTQIIPMTRKACYAGMMTATPRLMEPIYSVHVTCSSYYAVKAISKILSKRRGHVIRDSEQPIPATKLFTLEGLVPVIESVGLETDIRLQTQGQAMVFLELSKWDIVPGNPLDKDCFLPTLRPVPTESLARDFVLKTRKRKGLSGEPNLQKYIDHELYEKLKESSLI